MLERPGRLSLTIDARQILAVLGTMLPAVPMGTERWRGEARWLERTSRSTTGSCLWIAVALAHLAVAGQVTTALANTANAAGATVDGVAGSQSDAQPPDQDEGDLFGEDNDDLLGGEDDDLLGGDDDLIGDEGPGERAEVVNDLAKQEGSDVLQQLKALRLDI